MYRTTPPAELNPQYCNDNCSPIATCIFLSKISVLMLVLDILLKLGKCSGQHIQKFGQVVDNLIKEFACGLH
jgi:hypothetical protein